MSDPGLVVAFVVGVTPGKWARVWAERLPRHPLALIPLGQADALAALDEGSADVAIVRLPIDAEHVNAIPLYEELAMVVAPKDHAIEAVDAVTLADLAAETVLHGEWEEAVALVAANVGVAVMPQSVARALSRRDVVARLVTDAPSTRVALVWPSDRTSPLVEEFVGIVRGRTANSSRGSAAEAPVAPARAVAARPTKRPAPPKRGARRR